MEHEILRTLPDLALQFGACKAAVISVKEISFDRSFRGLCTSNACGMYGKCYMCPPDVGEIDGLIEEGQKYTYALVYQTVSELEDSFDFEGMTAARKRTVPIGQKLRKAFAALPVSVALHLGAGGCGVCAVCAKRTKEPCRFPELAMPSLEAYGVNASKLAGAAGMKYINGQNTVTYFGAVLFSLSEEAE